MDIYKKLPRLKDGQIRLLQITEFSEASPEVVCDLRVVSLSDRPEYFALSYTWGLPFPRYEEEFLAINDREEDNTTGRETTAQLKMMVEIKCNGEDIIIGRNLYDFLFQFSKQPDEVSRGPIWVDALCIDQSNLQERSQQVQLMGDIYKAASQVVVWLGVETTSIPLALELIRAIASASAPERAKLAHPSQLSLQNDNIMYDRKHWAGMARFFERTWFMRAWIIQEVTFARNITVWCGSHTLGWDEVTTVSGFLAKSSWADYFKDAAALGGSTDSISTRRQNVPAKLAATKRTWSSSSSDGLLYALIRARTSSCEDPRDKVYSQLKLGNADIFPSYEVPVVDVYITAARHILGSSDNLLLLTCVEGPDFQRLPGLPSWVPDWSVTKDLGLRVTGYGTFNTARNLERKFKVISSEGKHVLSVEATMIDTIAKAGETKEELQDFSRPTRLWDIIAELDHTYVTNESREDVLWRTLMTNRGHAPHSASIDYPAGAYLRDSFRTWIIWRYLVASRKSPSLLSSSFPAPTSLESLLSPRDTIFDSIRQSVQDPSYEASIARQASLFHAHYSHAMFLRPFRTQQGYFGLGSQSLSDGDSVWVVAGCRVPLIFRSVERSTRYQLVGGTYLHGFMDGQALKQGAVQFQMVELE